MPTVDSTHARATGLLSCEGGAAAVDGVTRAAPPSGFEFEFTLPGQAIPWARTGGGLNTPRFTPAKQRSYMGALKDFCFRAMRGARPIEGPVELSIMAIYPWPKSLSPRNRAQPGAKWKTSRPDAGNLAKIIEDALNTVAWRDDAQVVSAHTWKQYGDHPRVTVRIRELVY